MEAAAMGLPCITTDIRGCREAVLDGVTGLIVPPRDVVSLVAAMEHMLLSSEMRQKMGQAALQQAHSNFDRARVVEQTLALYEQVRKQHQ